MTIIESDDKEIDKFVQHLETQGFPAEVLAEQYMASGDSLSKDLRDQKKNSSSEQEKKILEELDNEDRLAITPDKQRAVCIRYMVHESQLPQNRRIAFKRFIQRYKERAKLGKLLLQKLKNNPDSFKEFCDKNNYTPSLAVSCIMNYLYAVHISQSSEYLKKGVFILNLSNQEKRGLLDFITRGTDQTKFYHTKNSASLVKTAKNMSNFITAIGRNVWGYDQEGVYPRYSSHLNEYSVSGNHFGVDFTQQELMPVPGGISEQFRTVLMLELEGAIVFKPELFGFDFGSNPEDAVGHIFEFFGHSQKEQAMKSAKNVAAVEKLCGDLKQMKFSGNSSEKFQEKIIARRASEHRETGYLIKDALQVYMQQEKSNNVGQSEKMAPSGTSSYTRDKRAIHVVIQEYLSNIYAYPDEDKSKTAVATRGRNSLEHGYDAKLLRKRQIEEVFFEMLLPRYQDRYGDELVFALDEKGGVEFLDASLAHLLLTEDSEVMTLHQGQTSLELKELIGKILDNILQNYAYDTPEEIEDITDDTPLKPKIQDITKCIANELRKDLLLKGLVESSDSIIQRVKEKFAIPQHDSDLQCHIQGAQTPEKPVTPSLELSRALLRSRSDGSISTTECSSSCESHLRSPTELSSSTPHSPSPPKNAW